MDKGRFLSRVRLAYNKPGSFSRASRVLRPINIPRLKAYYTAALHGVGWVWNNALKNERSIEFRHSKYTVMYFFFVLLRLPLFLLSSLQSRANDLLCFASRLQAVNGNEVARYPKCFFFFHSYTAINTRIFNSYLPPTRR